MKLTMSPSYPQFDPSNPDDQRFADLGIDPSYHMSHPNPLAFENACSSGRDVLLVKALNKGSRDWPKGEMPTLKRVAADLRILQYRVVNSLDRILVRKKCHVSAIQLQSESFRGVEGHDDEIAGIHARFERVFLDLFPGVPIAFHTRGKPNDPYHVEGRGDFATCALYRLNDWSRTYNDLEAARDYADNHGLPLMAAVALGWDKDEGQVEHVLQHARATATLCLSRHVDWVHLYSPATQRPERHYELCRAFVEML